MKTLVDVGVPAISEHYDVRIPTFLTVREVTELIAKAVEELSNQTYKSSGTEFLCFAEKDILLIKDKVLEEYRIRNGDHLLLI